MINREITYKRDINSSYMIIPGISEESFDEERILQRNLPGLLPIEKCYVAAVGQYWYDITGKQALDGYCRINNIGKTFFENLILKLCQTIECLEWNLIDVNCLVLDPEMVFLNVYGEEVSFVAYPFHNGDLRTELQQLLEYLLTKLDHKDNTVVGWAYKLYEMVLMEGMSIAQLKRVILEERTQKVVLEPEKQYFTECVQEENRIELPQTAQEEQHKGGVLEQISIARVKEVIMGYIQGWKEQLRHRIEALLGTKDKQEMPRIIYPEEEEKEEQVTIHPTVGLGVVKNESHELSCDRKGDFPDYVLEKGAYLVGKNPQVQIRINKDTVSQYHARIEYQGEGYYIEDLNSTNGTYVNEQLLSYKSRKQLQRGDSIRFGDVGYHFY